MSTAGTPVPLALLRESFEILIAHLSETHGETVSVETDYFWSVPKDDLGNVYESPPQLTIGQVTESLDNLREIVADPASVISYGLVWLGDVLKAVGYENVA